MAVTWDIRVREGQSPMLRLEVYNVFHHPQFGYPAQSVTAKNFGQISTQVDARGFFTDGFDGAQFMQAALRFRF